MSRERWFRGGDDTTAFDWSSPARELDVSMEIARGLYSRAMRQAEIFGVARPEALYLSIYAGCCRPLESARSRHGPCRVARRG